MSDDSALTPSSQPFSPITLADESSVPGHYNRHPNHAHSDGYMTAESSANEAQYTASVSEGWEEGGEREGGEREGGERDGGWDKSCGRQFAYPCRFLMSSLAPPPKPRHCSCMC